MELILYTNESDDKVVTKNINKAKTKDGYSTLLQEEQANKSDTIHTRMNKYSKSWYFLRFYN